jgi:hypothetical protein
MILDHRPSILYWSPKGAKEKNKMSFDIDTTLWVLMGIAVLFVACGCVLTAPAGTFRRSQ